ncbi:hypothetical protein L208DRAFT_1253106, partial [Tricholoma matsutake]
PLLGVPPIHVICSIILTLDFPLLEAEVALILMMKKFLRLLGSLVGTITFASSATGLCRSVGTVLSLS